MTDPAPEPARRKRSRLPRGLAAFKHRNYRLFYFGQFISVTGTWMQTLAQSWLVLSLTSSAFQLGLVSVFQFAPMLVLGLFAGAIADRVPKRKLLVCTQAISAVLAGTLAILTFTDTVQLWQVYTLAFLLGVNNAFDMPTRQAFVVEMVGKEDLTNAIALNSSIFNAARIVGPAIAGALLAVFGPAVCFAINSVSYIAVITGLLMMQLAPTVRVQTNQRRLEQIREGLRYVRRTPEILRPIVLVGFVATFGMNTNIWVPLLAKNDLNSGAGGFGLLMSSMGAGSLAGALGLAFLVSSVKRWMLFSTAGALGVCLLLLALVGAVPLAIPIAMLVMAGIGLVSTTTMAIANTTVQAASPDELRGRIMSVYTTVFTGTAPFGALVASSIANRFGTPASLLLGGTITLLAVTAVLLTGGAKLSVREHLHLPSRRRI
jgi:MFS family permease